MKCMSCGAEIPPQWVHSIQTNTCAGCGGPIMNTEAQELLKELTAAMERMPNDPQGLAGWLLSNYDLFKIGDANPTERFHRKNQKARGDFDESQLKIAPDPSQEFFKRAGVNQSLLAKKANQQNNKMAALASNILEVEDPYSSESGENDDIEVDEEDLKAYQAFQKDGVDPFVKTEQSVANLPQMGGFVNNEEDEEQLSDIEKGLMVSDAGKAILTKERIKKLRAQEAIQGGGGSFRRSG